MVFAGYARDGQAASPPCMPPMLTPKIREEGHTLPLCQGGDVLSFITGHFLISK